MAKIIINGADFSEAAIGNKYFSELDCKVQGVGINYSTGAVVENYPLWASTDFLEIANLSSLKVETNCVANSFGFAIYDSSKTYIDGLSYGQAREDKTLTMDLPATASYLRFCIQLEVTYGEAYAHYTLTK